MNALTLSKWLVLGDAVQAIRDGAEPASLSAAQHQLLRRVACKAFLRVLDNRADVDGPIRYAGHRFELRFGASGSLVVWDADRTVAVLATPPGTVPQLAALARDVEVAPPMLPAAHT